MREEIRRIHRQTKITTLYVTHDQQEALSLADRMAIMRTGNIDALGPPRNLYRHPPSRFSADFLGDVNPLSGKLSDDGQTVSTEIGEIPVSATARPENVKPGGAVVVFCRPENVVVAEREKELTLPPDYHTLNADARVVSGAFLGESTLYELELPGKLRWRVLRHETGSQGIPDGTPVKVAVARPAWAVVGK
jgi:ABC-type Fe3+/spermidine/putrescine transport system ATPase subunit